MSAPVPPRRAARALLLAALVVAFALRLPVGEVPPGLYRDEAYYGLDAVQTLAGQPALYYPANHGREPLFIQLAAAFVALLGRTPAALRLASAFVGVATVAATFAVGRNLAGVRVGLVGAWLCAVTPWPVLLGRTGFRAGTLPLLLALALAATVIAWRRREGRWALAGGGLAGLSLYTYTAGRLLPLLFLLLGAWAWWAGRRGWARPAPGRAWLSRWALAALAVVAPLALWLAAHPEHLGERAGEVALWNPAIGGADPLAALARSAAATVGLIAVRGDFIPRHNVPLRPVFGPLAGSLALLGLALALLWARRRPALLVLPLWAGVMALPTLLAEGAPHFLRAVGLLPAVMLLPGLGAEGLRGAAARLGPRPAWLAWGLAAALAVGGEAAATLAVLRGAAAPGEALYYAFESGATELARDLNTTLGRGWRGGWAEGPAGAGQPVWLDRRLRDGWAALPFLVPEARLTLADPYDPILTRLPGVAYLQPEGLEPDGLWSRLAPGARLDFRPGAMERGDLEAEASRLYVRVSGEPAAPAAAPLARFANGLALLAAELQVGPDGRTLDVVSTWSAAGPTPADVTAFFQVLEGDRRLAGDDAVLGSGLYPSPRWRRGDQVVERRRLVLDAPFDPARQRLVAGIYVAPDTRPLPVVDAAGRPVGDYVALPAD